MRFRKPLFRATVIAALNALLLLGVAAAQETPTVPAPRYPAWSYNAAQGPEHWGEISDQFALCASGEAQSPIEIRRPAPSELGDILFNYKPSALMVENAGYSVQVNYDAGSAVTFDHHTYMLKKLVIHAPSEHIINGRQYAMEIQLVHEDAFGKMLVVSVMGQRGQRNQALRGVLNAASSLRAEPWTIIGVTFDANAVLPEDRDSYYSYVGSLTTPPCTEGVRWLIMQTPIRISQPQIDDFLGQFGFSARPVQALNGRDVVSQAGAG